MSGLSTIPKTAFLSSVFKPSKISRGIPLTAVSVVGSIIDDLSSSLNVSKISRGIPLTALSPEG